MCIKNNYFLKHNKFNFYIACNFKGNPSLFYNMITSFEMHLIQRTTYGIMHFLPPKFKFYIEK